MALDVACRLLSLAVSLDGVLVAERHEAIDGAITGLIGCLVVVKVSQHCARVVQCRC